MTGVGSSQLPPQSAPLSRTPDRSDSASSIEVPRADPSDLFDRAGATLSRAIAALYAKQRSEPWGGQTGVGPHWCGELEGDSILSSEYLLMKVILEQEKDEREWARLRRVASHLRLTQRTDGTWGQYPGSPPDVSACVKAYFALKLFGDSPELAHMRRARDAIRALGGAERCNTFSTFYLACLGQVSWDACPAIPPEIALLPRWFPFHMDKVAAWTRTMILPLAICSATRPVTRVPSDLGIEELFLDPSARTRLNKRRDPADPFTWNNVFLSVDRVLKFLQKHGVTPMRAKALRAAEWWLLDRMSEGKTEGLGAIFPPMVYIQVALRSRGYDRAHPVLRKAERDLDAFMIDCPHPDPRLDHVRIQPCFSPVWDTSIAVMALAEAGERAASDPRLASACDWLRAREVAFAGDWVRNLREPDRRGPIEMGKDLSAWAFEYCNEFYPDVDDTCMAAKAFARAGDRPGESANADAAARAVRFILAMQNDDGGWAAFDRTTHREWMEHVPFADHNAMQDPSCADITGRVMEALAFCAVPPDHPAMRAGLAFLRATQRPEGCWWGRWGVNYIYGTWQAVNGIRAAGVPVGDPALQRALRWVRSIQNADGGFGESANSYLDPSLMGVGESTPSQTAWGLMTLLHLAGAEDPAARRAVAWLCGHQLAADKPPFTKSHTVASVPDAGSDAYAHLDPVSDIAGSWNEHLFTGTGFPKVFYLRYHLYRHSFPVMALGRFLRAAAHA